MPEKSRKDRPIYVPPPRREESCMPETNKAKPRLEVKLDIKKERVIHAWEKEENGGIEEKGGDVKVIHAWEVADQSSFQLPPKPLADRDQTAIEPVKKGNRHSKSKQSFRKISKTDSKRNISYNRPASTQSTKDSSLPSQNEPPKVTFVNAKEYLDQMSTSDWNDLEELDYTKVPKWNH